MKEPAPDLAARIAAGDSAAFAEVYDRFAGRMYRFLLARTAREDVAEDLVGAVMLRLVRHRRKVAGVRDLGAWLFTLARNELARSVSRRRLPQDDGTDPELLPAPPDPPDAEALGDLAAAVRRLSPERREVVSLRVFDRMTFAKIGACLAISPNTASTRWRAALADLSRMLEQHHERTE